MWGRPQNAEECTEQITTSNLTPLNLHSVSKHPINYKLPAKWFSGSQYGTDINAPQIKTWINVITLINYDVWLCIYMQINPYSCLSYLRANNGLMGFWKYSFKRGELRLQESEIAAHFSAPIWSFNSLVRIFPVSKKAFSRSLTLHCLSLCSHSRFTRFLPVDSVVTVFCPLPRCAV